MKQKRMTAKKFRHIFVTNSVVAIASMAWAIVMVVQYIELRSGNLIIKWEVENQLKEAIITMWASWTAFCPLTIFIPIMVAFSAYENVHTALKARNQK